MHKLFVFPSNLDRPVECRTLTVCMLLTSDAEEFEEEMIIDEDGKKQTHA